MADRNSKILLTQNITVKITNDPPASTSCATSASPSRQSPFEDDFDKKIIDDLDFDGDIYIDDELHLVGKGTRASPFLSTKTVIMLMLNIIFISLSITWLMTNGFRFDLIGTIFIALSAWALFINIVNTWKIMRKIHERNLIAGKPNDFKNYVARLQNSQQPASVLINPSGQPTNGAVYV